MEVLGRGRRQAYDHRLQLDIKLLTDRGLDLARQIRQVLVQAAQEHHLATIGRHFKLVPEVLDLSTFRTAVSRHIASAADAAWG